MENKTSPTLLVLLKALFQGSAGCEAPLTPSSFVLTLQLDVLSRCGVLDILHSHPVQVTVGLAA